MSLFVLITIPAMSQTTGSAGSGQSFDNRQPTLAVQYLMPSQAYFPAIAALAPATVIAPPLLLGEIRVNLANTLVPGGYLPCEGQALSIGSNQALFSLLGTTYGGDGTSTFALPDLRNSVPIGVGQGPGLPAYVLGQRDGVRNYTLTVANLPAHAHATPGGTTGSTGLGQAFDNLQPSLALNFMITINGELALFAGTFTPDGWTLCDGHQLQISQYLALFSIIGTNYGWQWHHNLCGAGFAGTIPGDGRASERVEQLWHWPNQCASELALTTAKMPSHSHSLQMGSTVTTGGGVGFDNRQPTLALTWLVGRGR